METLSMAPTASLYERSINPTDSASNFSRGASSGQPSIEETVNMLVDYLVKAAYLAGANAGVNAGMNAAFDFMSTQDNSMLSHAATDKSSVGAASAASTAPVSVAPPGSIALTDEARQRQLVEGATPVDNRVNKEEEDAEYLEAYEARQNAEAIPQLVSFLNQRTVHQR
jgi:hypothetical protein